MKTRSKPAAYPALPFHSIRALSALSALVVSAILSFFCYQLKHDNYKLPWTFLIMMLASLLVLICLVLTGLVHCCAHLSPIFSMFINIPLFCLWTVGMALLIWNMYGTLGHTCTKANWASDDGMMICRTYKALFAFVIIGWLVQIAVVVLDVRARRNQTARGVYDRMNEAREAEGDVKLDEIARPQPHAVPDIPYGVNEFRDRDSFSERHQQGAAYALQHHQKLQQQQQDLQQQQQPQQHFYHHDRPIMPSPMGSYDQGQDLGDGHYRQQQRYHDREDARVQSFEYQRPQHVRYDSNSYAYHGHNGGQY